MFSHFPQSLQRYASVSLLTLTAVAISACGGSSQVTLSVKSAATADTTASLRAMDGASISMLSGAVESANYGESIVGSGGVESFKLYVQEIRFCESIEINGTGYNNPTNCSSIYVNNGDNYDTFGVTEAAAAGADKYIDLVSSTERAKLTQTAEIDAGTYNYGIINWYKPVKLKARINRGTAADLCTKSSGGTLSSDNVLQFASGGLTCGASPEEAVIPLNNGGTWFKFLTPFTAEDDGSYAVDLAFNLDNKVKGGAGMSNVAIQEVNNGTSEHGINVPLLSVVPVPRAASTSTKVDTFEMTPAGSSEWKFRVDLYYNSADSAKSVLAADVTVLGTTSTASNIVANVYAPTSISTSGTTLTFKDYLGNTTLVFDRSGTSGTYTCPSGSTLAGCSSGSTTTMTYSTPTTRTLN